LCTATLPATARTIAHHAPPPSPWEQAVEAKQRFEGTPDEGKTKIEFAKVLDRFRAIYHENPRDTHAAEAVNAVAELLAEQGRVLEDAKSSENAVAQYEFLRTQYPGSPLRIPALLAEGKIEAGDLHDAGAAKDKYDQLLKQYPRSAPAAEARTELAGLAAPSVGGGERESKVAKGGPVAAAKSGPVAGRDGAGKGAGVASSAPAPGVASAPETRPVAAGRMGQSAPVEDSILTGDAPGDGDAGGRVETKRVSGVVSGVVSGGERGSGKAMVTGIRHWSTPNYTRVAIDLGDEVTFEAARVPNPDRIYFDLHGSRLSQELVGKSFAVTDDGFLKRIRAGQSSADVTRVVLDVNDVTEYSAFLLPNPYRLIIDIHGGAAAKTVVAEGRAVPAPAVAAPASLPAAAPRVVSTDDTERTVTASASTRASAAANVSGLPAMAPTDGGAMVKAPEPDRAALAEMMRPVTPVKRPSGKKSQDKGIVAVAPAPVVAPAPIVVAKAAPLKPVPNTVVERAPTTTTEVADVSLQPGRVEATNAPTSRPISAVVLGSGGRTTPGVMDAPLPKHAKGVDGAPSRPADRTADGETSLIRALGLRIGRIVIDAGHGGHDSGTLGAGGIEEKDVVLDVALRLGKMLHERLGAEIIYTRSDDTFIPLETRTAIANKAQADLFLSIHANSSSDETARGVETYYLNFTSDATALDVAARENAVSGQSIHQLSDLVKKITLKDKIAESREFASDVEGSLFTGLERGNLGLKNRGVKKAPFVVLIGANMPSILAEISFVTNPEDARQLRTPEYRQRVAESLYNGVAKYESSLGGGRPVVTNRASVK
jgi:N-acetylmuramoyl-L-alanine amidase